MTKKEAIQDAKDRVERTGIVWHVIRIKQGFLKYIYEAVSEHHLTTHRKLYKSGKFKSIEKFKPDTDAKIDLSFLNLDRATRRKLERKLTKVN